MKFLLVNPDYEIERYMGRHFGRMGWVMPPMGLLYLAAALENEGIGVSIYDAQIEERSLRDVVAEESPEIVGITCATALVGSTLAAAKMVKAAIPATTVVTGGVHPTVRPNDLLEGGDVDIDDWMQLSSMGGYREDELFYVPEGRDSDELKRLQRRANFGFYFRPRIMLGFVGRIRSFGELGEYARGAWGLLKATVAPY